MTQEECTTNDIGSVSDQVIIQRYNGKSLSEMSYVIAGAFCDDAHNSRQMRCFVADKINDKEMDLWQKDGGSVFTYTMSIFNISLHVEDLKVADCPNNLMCADFNIDFELNFDLPETYRSRTKVGDRVIITPDSLPALKLYGKIGKIATLPVNQISWDSASPKVYNSRIVLDRQDPQLVNGMSVQIEVISRVIKNTLFIPVEAVFERQSSFYVYRRVGGTPKETAVSIGESNDNFVQITDGLEEGDVVYLYRPYDKKQSE